MPWYTPAPAPDLPITSAWGNAIENASFPIFATLATLQAGWTDAPDGAHAFVLQNRKTYTRRGGTWRLPLENVQGVVVYQFAGPTSLNFAPIAGSPGASMAGFGPFNLIANRIYAVTLHHRIQLLDNTPNQALAIHLNFMGTGRDVPLQWNGGAPEFANGQVILENAFPLPFQNALMQCAWGGSCLTQGVDDQPLPIRAQVVMNNSTSHYSVAEVWVTCVDQGPSS